MEFLLMLNFIDSLFRALLLSRLLKCGGCKDSSMQPSTIVPEKNTQELFETWNQ